MLLIWITIIIFLIGAMGGIQNALLSDNGFFLPKLEKIDSVKVWRPGVVGNMVFGAGASLITWGLYGPFSQYALISLQQSEQGSVSLTIASLVGAFLTGIGGSRIITNELDKSTLTKAAAKAARAQSNDNASVDIATSKPIEALRSAERALSPTSKSTDSGLQ